MQKHGFELVKEEELAEVGGTARLWRHAATGAELLSVINQDENKCFGASFYTPPVDSTGVAHILEHSVLCGSRKYPVKEPFAELLKGSLQTFLNAFTFPDKTCYPVASANLQDFYNLIDVYLDAVFHPLLTKETFMQEGCHVEAESADGPWTFKGVVYNEMKGVYSSPDSVLGEQSQQAVFPDNLYCLDSGGNPEKIPDLTWQAFTDFHSRYYQPGNARFFFWGDDPEDRRLKRIAQEIDGYGKVSDLPAIALQKPPAKSRYIERPYAAHESDRALVTLNWLLMPRGDIGEALKMEMLEHILEGLPGSPLRRALMESGLGEDMTGCGLETDLRQMYYSTGLKGIAPADAGKVEECVLATLKRLAEEGMDKKAIAAAVNSVEFAYRENNTGRLPRGLAAMILSLSTWLYGEDPFGPLAWEKPLQEIKAAIAGNEPIFEELLKRHFLAAPYTRVTLLPDTSLGQTREEAEKARLAEIQAQAGADERAQMAEITQKLREAQLTPDAPEDLAKIPALSVKDLPLKNRVIPTRAVHAGTQTYLGHGLPTRGIAYVNILLPLAAVSPKLAPLLPLFARSLTECGTAREDYSELGMRIAANTGGFGAAMLTGASLLTRQPFCYLTLAGKAVRDKTDAIFSLAEEALLEPCADAGILLQRLGIMAAEAHARLEHGLQTAGHSAVNVRLGAHFTGAGSLAETMAGVSQLFYLRDLIKRLAAEPDGVLADLNSLRSLLVGAKNAIVDLACEEQDMDGLQSQAERFIGNLPGQPAAALGEAIASWQPMAGLPKAEAFITQSQVNYVGKAADLYQLGYEFAGSANVILHSLRMGHLWEKVRVAGGAYGVFCQLDRVSGVFACASYRDPAIEPTLSTYDGLAAYLRANPPDQARIDQAIVGAVGALDAYLLPDAAAGKALAWYLAGLSDEMRQQSREQMLATTAADFLAFANVLEGYAQTGDIAVLGGSLAETCAREEHWQIMRLQEQA